MIEGIMKWMKSKLHVLMLSGTILLQIFLLYFILMIFNIIPDQYYVGTSSALQENRDIFNVGYNSTILIICFIILIFIDINILFIKKINPAFTKVMNWLCYLIPIPLFIIFFNSGFVDTIWMFLISNYSVLLIPFNSLVNDITQQEQSKG